MVPPNGLSFGSDYITGKWLSDFGDGFIWARHAWREHRLDINLMQAMLLFNSRSDC